MDINEALSVFDGLVSESMRPTSMLALQTLKSFVLAQLSHNKPSMQVCPHYSREMVKSTEYVEFDICTCKGNTGKPAHVG